MKQVTNINNVIKLYYEFKVLKEELMKKSTFLKHVCYCRTNIMERYIDSVCNLTMLLTGYFLDVNQMKKCSCEKRKAILNRYFKIFETQAYGIFKNGDLLNYKTLLLFKKIQGYVETQIFERIEDDYEELLSENTSLCEIDEITTVNDFHTRVLNYMHTLGEMAILSISSLKINCTSISDEIYDDTTGISDTAIHEYRKKTDSFIAMGSACHRRTTEIPLNEMMHLFILDTYIEDVAGFVKHCIDLAQTYYAGSEKLHVILDFGLSEAEMLCTEDIDKILKLNEIKKLYVTNCLDIDFCENDLMIKMLYIDKDGIQKLCQN